jgi:hypothetical protein
MTTNLQNESASQITDEINKKIYDRNLPSQFLQPYLSVRPVMTKYSLMPIVDPRAPINVPLIQQPVYNVHNVFNPGNTQSPWSGFASNINNESILRNQVFALQECSQSVYVPSSKSDLYNYGFHPDKSGNKHQPFPGLFHKEKFCEFDPNTENISHGLFMNHTRQQLKETAFEETLPPEEKERMQKLAHSNPQQQNPQQQNQTMAQISNKKSK